MFRGTLRSPRPFFPVMSWCLLLQRYQDMPGVEHIPVVQIDLSVPLKVPGKYLHRQCEPGEPLSARGVGAGSSCQMLLGPALEASSPSCTLSATPRAASLAVVAPSLEGEWGAQATGLYAGAVSFLPRARAPRLPLLLWACRHSESLCSPPSGQRGSAREFPRLAPAQTTVGSLC